MKTIKTYRKIVWAIEHRKNCLLKSDDILGYHIYSTKTAAEWAIANSGLEDASPVKVRISIERAFSSD